MRVPMFFHNPKNPIPRLYARKKTEKNSIV